MPPDVPATVKAGVVVAVATEINPPVKLTEVTVPVPAGVAQVPSPRKKFDAEGVPVTGLAAMFVTVLIKVPLTGNVNDVLAVAVNVLVNAPE